MLKSKVESSTSKRAERKVLYETKEILSSLSNVDSLKIFQMAKDGIQSSTKTIKELKLTQKRYYTRLNQLIKAGLIEKNMNTYKHTILGKICFKMGETFNDLLLNRDQLDLMDRLNKSKSLSLEETKEIARAISKGSMESFGESLISDVRVADTYEKLVNDVIEYIEKAEEKVYFATKYFDVRVSEALLRSIKKGIEMTFLSGDKEDVANRVKVLRTMISKPRMLKFFFEFINSPDFRVRYVELPYTFIVIDGKYAMIEVTKPYTNAFSMAFFFNDEKLCEKLIETFEMLWKRGSDMTEILDKSLPLGMGKLMKKLDRSKK